MFGTADLAGWAQVLVALATLLGAVNATLNILLHRRQGRTNTRVAEVDAKVETVMSQLKDHYGRVESSYDIMAQESRALTSYIQGLNTPIPKGGRP